MSRNATEMSNIDLNREK